MTSQNRIRHAVTRRLWAAATLKITGRALLIAAGVVLLILLIDKAVLPDPLPPAVYAVPIAAGLLAALGVAWHRRPSHEQVLTQIDDRLGLKDRLSTAHYLNTATGSIDGRIHAHIQQDAEQAAEQARHQTRHAFQVRFTRVWAWLPVAIAVLALCAFILPNNFLGLQGTANSSDPIAQQEIQQLKEIVHQDLTHKTQATDGEQAETEELNAQQLMEQANQLLAQTPKTPQAQATQQALLDQKAQQMQQMAEQMQQQQNQLENQLSRLNTHSPNSPGQQLEQALRSGDLEKARQAAEDLARKLEQGAFDEQQMAALQQQLAQMAQQLQPNSPNQPSGNAANNPQQNPSQQQLQQLAQSLQKMGQNANPQQAPNAAQQSRMLQQASQQAQQAIQQMQQQQQNLQSLKQCQGQCQGGPTPGTPGAPGSAGQGQLAQGQQGGPGHPGQNSTRFGPGSGGPAVGDQDNRLNPGNYSTAGVRHAQDASDGRQTILLDHNGPMLVGEATKQFNTVRRAQTEAIERAVAEDRLPTRYNRMRQAYFNNANQTAE